MSHAVSFKPDVLTRSIPVQVNPACAAQSLVVPDLNYGQEYIFRIKAENRFGFGPYAETPEGARAQDPIRKCLHSEPGLF